MNYVFITLLFITGCGGGVNKDTEVPNKVFNQSVKLLTPGIRMTESSIEGTGAIVFTERWPDRNSGMHIEIEMQLSDGGSVELVSFASSQLEGGIEFISKRQGQQLFTQWQQNANRVETGLSFQNIDASNIVRLSFDIHNHESPAHIVGWKEFVKSANATEIFNSEEETENGEFGFGSPGNGSGAHWGLRINNAKITYIKNSQPYHQH